MADQIPISGLPPAVSLSTSDIFPIVHSGTTEKESMSQLLSFLQSNLSSLNSLALGGASVPTNLLTVNGTSYFSSDISQVAGTFATGATTIQFASLTTGILHANTTGVITSSSINLASSDVSGILSSLNGGTGINNGSNTVTLGGNILTHGKFEIDGAFDTLFNVTASTNVTFPTSGTLLSTTSGGYVNAISGENYLSLVSQTITANPVNLSGTNVTGTLAAARFPSLTGDVTTTAGSLATTISNNAVSNAKFRQSSALSVVANATNATANVADLKSTAANQILASNTSGNALIFTANPTVATMSAIGSGGGSGVFQAFTNNNSTSATSSTGIGAYVQNSDTTTNNWMSYGFLNAAGNIVSVIGCQMTNQTGTTQCDVAIYAKSLAGVVTEGFRLVGATNTIQTANPIGAAYGGTGNATYAIGDLLQASASTTLSRLAAVATGNVLLSGGVTTVSSWGKAVLGTHTTGNYVATAIGTTNQVNVSGSTGNVTFSLPQSISTTSNVSFGSVVSTNSSQYCLFTQNNNSSTSAVTNATNNANQLFLNQNSTNNNWMTQGFLRNDGTLSAIFGYQVTTQSTGAGDFVLLPGNSSGTATETFRARSSGDISAPSNTGFSYIQSGNVSNVTGDGTIYTLTFDTSKYNIGSHFDGTTFTAAYTGRYLFSVGAPIINLTSSVTSANIKIIVSGTSANGYSAGEINAGAMRDSNAFCGLNLCVPIFMTAGDTAVAKIVAFGTTKTIGVGGTNASSTGNFNYFTCQYLG